MVFHSIKKFWILFLLFQLARFSIKEVRVFIFFAQPTDCLNILNSVIIYRVVSWQSGCSVLLRPSSVCSSRSVRPSKEININVYFMDTACYIRLSTVLPSRDRMFAKHLVLSQVLPAKVLISAQDSGMSDPEYIVLGPIPSDLCLIRCCAKVIWIQWVVNIYLKTKY